MQAGGARAQQAVDAGHRAGRDPNLAAGRGGAHQATGEVRVGQDAGRSEQEVLAAAQDLAAELPDRAMAGRLDDEVRIERQQFLDRTGDVKAAGCLGRKLGEAVGKIEHAEQALQLAAGVETADDLLGDGAIADDDDTRLRFHVFAVRY